MSRYHFHVIDGTAALNLAVVDLPDYEAVLARAEELSAALLLNEPYRSDPDAWEVRVTDEQGKEVLSLPLSEVAGKGPQVQVVPWGDGRWGVAATLDSPDRPVTYPVGTRKDAEAEAERLVQSSSDSHRRDETGE
jgi:hypothetical protein